MNLTTLDKVLLYMSNDGTKRSLVEALIPEVSRRAETYMHRNVEAIERTEFFDIARDVSSVQLSAWPTTTIAVYNDTARSFTSAISSNDYVVTTYGRVKFDYRLLPGNQALKVVHTSGMASTTSAFIDAYPDIAGAIAKQVAYEALRDKNLGSDAFSFAGGGAIGVTNSIDWLPMVKDILDQYARADCAY